LLADPTSEDSSKDGFIEGLQSSIRQLSDCFKTLISEQWLIKDIIPLMRQSDCSETFIKTLASSYDQSNPIIAIYLIPLFQVHADTIGYEKFLTIFDVQQNFRFFSNLW